MIRRFAFVLLAVALAAPTILPGQATAQEQGAQEPGTQEPGAGEEAALEEMLADRVLGNPDAPVTIVEYSSFTCPHCATFHADILPKLKESYIQDGQVKLIYRDFPLDGRALAASMLTRCVDPQRYYGFVDLLFQDQQAWAGDPDIRRALMVRARLAGLSEAEFDACLENDALAQAINERAVQAGDERGIQSTPTFFVNDRRVRGAVPFEQFREVIEEELGGTRSTDAGSGSGSDDASGPGARR